MTAYHGVAFAIQRAKTGSFAGRSQDYLTRVFDSATFAGSGVLLLGIYGPAILALIGDTTFFLIIAGLAGMIYALQALQPRA